MAALVGLFALVLALLAPASPAAAHADLESSDPADGAVLAASPAVIKLVFSEAVTPVPGAFRLFGSAGELPQPDATATGATVSVRPAGDATGRLLLAYRVISGDGHPVSGTLSFTVGTDTGGAPVGPQASADDPAVGWLTGALTSAQYAGLLLGVGLLIFGGWVARTPVLPARRGRPGCSPSRRLRRWSRSPRCAARGLASAIRAGSRPSSRARCSRSGWSSSRAPRGGCAARSPPSWRWWRSPRPCWWGTR
ncbi:hypothetical protein BW730_13165 [Tessaracoccus aquimaris]|uniref:CopC domain-containing protein n=2 Tax=Tessaracoccus aquimaris TaxID=1332264 RepID=A0A1Q2CQK8_9ACTN|nr:hypothetical protein BW730_13165 [Tessaracoccus aquimaris]